MIYSPRTRQITWPLATASPTATASCATAPGAVRTDLVLHLHRLDEAEHLALLDRVAVGDLDLQHRPLHRADDGVAARPARPATRPLAPPPGELGPRRLRLEQRHLEAAPADLDGARPRPQGRPSCVLLEPQWSPS